MSNSGPQRSVKRTAQRSQMSLPYARPTPKPASERSSWSFSGIMSFLRNPFVALTPAPTIPAEEAFQPPQESESQVGVVDNAEPTPVRSTSTGPIPAIPFPLVASTAPPQATLPPPPPARAPVVQNRPITPPPSPPRPAETAQDVLRYLERKSGNGLHLNVFELESLTNTLEAAARSGSSPAKARRAADYLKTKGPELNLNAVEFDGFKNILREAAAARVQDPLPQRPTFTPGPAGASRASGSTTTGARQKRMLSSNPMGRYTIDGTASTRARNKFASPAFGSTRGPVQTLKIAPPVSPGKRRRTEDDGAAPTASTSAAPPPPKSASPKKAPQVNGRLAPERAKEEIASRLSRSPAPPLLSPSPLRQAWSAASGSDSETSPIAQKVARNMAAAVPQATRSANILSGIIKEATPRVTPAAVINPYESANGVPVRRRQAQAQRKKALGEKQQKEKEEKERIAREAREERERERVEEMVKKMSPQAGIEMSVPKGAKRARPPVELVNKKPAPEPTQPPRRSERIRSKSPEPIAPSAASLFTFATSSAPEKPSPAQVEIIEIEDEDEAPPTKKARNEGTLPTKPNGPVIEEIEEIDAPSSGATKPAEVVEPKSNGYTRATSPHKEGRAFSPQLLKSSAPARPSNLRFFSVADESKEDQQEEPESIVEKDVDIPPIVGFASFAPPAPTTNGVAAPAPERSAVAASVASSLPVFQFGQHASPSPPTSAAVAAAAALTPAAPSFDIATSAFSFGRPAPPLSSGFSFKDTPEMPSAFASKATPIVAPISAPMLPTKPVAPQTSPKTAVLAISPAVLPTFAFSRPGPSDASTSTQRGRASDEAKAAPAARVPSYTFAPGLATGFTLNATSGAGSGKGKAPAGVGLGWPGALSTAEPAWTASFDWGAAGAKAPAAAAPAAGEWTCELCMLKNSADATEKCSVCEAPKPGAAAAKSPPAAPAPPRTASFDWAAAGVAAPASTPAAGGWTCGVCMLANPAEATEKCKVCEEPKPGATKKDDAKPSTTKAPEPARTASFDWAAAGMKAPKAPAAAAWTCGVCMLVNPADATEKCTVCDAPR